jgi:GMP synthase-like glutamine amidotransferase
MKVHVFQHVPFEGLASIHAWLADRDAEVTVTRFFEHSPLPDIANLDLVIILGGPMSVNDEKSFPWLTLEKLFIRKAIHYGKAVLGICLGAQLIAKALGANVYPGPYKEIGWHDIQAVNGPPEFFRFPQVLSVFHWHGETFDLPHGAVHLARSDGCQNQAFQIGKRVIGLQFHLETTPQSVDAMISNCGDELAAGQFIQSAAEMRGVSATSYEAINQLMTEVLDFISG